MPRLSRRGRQADFLNENGLSVFYDDEHNQVVVQLFKPPSYICLDHDQANGVIAALVKALAAMTDAHGVPDKPSERPMFIE